MLFFLNLLSRWNLEVQAGVECRHMWISVDIKNYFIASESISDWGEVTNILEKSTCPGYDIWFWTMHEASGSSISPSTWVSDCPLYIHWFLSPGYHKTSETCCTWLWCLSFDATFLCFLKVTLVPLFSVCRNWQSPGQCCASRHVFMPLKPRYFSGYLWPKWRTPRWIKMYWWKTCRQNYVVDGSRNKNKPRIVILEHNTIKVGPLVRIIFRNAKLATCPMLSTCES